MSELKMKNDLKEIPFKNVEDVLAFAVQSEESAYRFYSEWSQKVEKPSMKKVFEELAQEEKGHKEFLLGIQSGSIPQPATGGVQDLKISDYLIEVKASTGMSYQDALIVAMHREKMAFRVYSRLMEMATQPQMKEMFTMLAQQEAKHKLRLEMIYDDEILTNN